MITLFVKNNILFFIVVFFCTIVFGQESKVQAYTEIDTFGYEFVKTYPAPSPNFITIHLQTHKNKLRFGWQDNYFVLRDGSHINHKSQNAYRIADKKSAQLKHSHIAFLELLKMNLMAASYKDLDKNKLTVYESSMYQDKRNSYDAQTHLLQLAYSISNLPTDRRFFCNPKFEKCMAEKENYYFKSSGSVRNWGGKNANEFRQLKTYRAYVQENLEELQQWAAIISSENPIDAYFVAQINHLGTYDFEHEGYWIPIAFINQRGFLVRFRDLEPQNATERKLLHPNGLKLLYAIAPDKAEDFAERTPSIYLVFNIKLFIEGINLRTNHGVDVKYQLLNPNISLYRDDSLTQKIGEININSAILK